MHQYRRVKKASLACVGEYWSGQRCRVEGCTVVGDVWKQRQRGPSDRGLGCQYQPVLVTAECHCSELHCVRRGAHSHQRALSVTCSCACASKHAETIARCEQCVGRDHRGGECDGRASCCCGSCWSLCCNGDARRGSPCEHISTSATELCSDGHTSCACVQCVRICMCICAVEQHHWYSNNVSVNRAHHTMLLRCYVWHSAVSVSAAVQSTPMLDVCSQTQQGTHRCQQSVAQQPELPVAE
jgi:hypothetical protein